MLGDAPGTIRTCGLYLPWPIARATTAANAHLLFRLSLIPVGTAWLGPHLRESAPVAVYGAVLLGAAIAYTILARTLIASHGPTSQIARAVGDDAKGKLSLVVPDRRIERVLSAGTGDGE